MEKEITNNKYRPIRSMAREIAARSGCSVVYVRQVLYGTRTPKTIRAQKAPTIIAIADNLLTALTINTK